MRDILKSIRDLAESSEIRYNSNEIINALDPQAIGAEDEEFDFLEHLRSRIYQSFPDFVTGSDIQNILREPSFRDYASLDTTELLDYVFTAAGFDGMLDENSAGGVASVALPMVGEEELEEDWGSSDWTPVVDYIDQEIEANGLTLETVEHAAIAAADMWYDEMGYESPANAVNQIIRMWTLRSETGKKMSQMFAEKIQEKSFKRKSNEDDLGAVDPQAEDKKKIDSIQKELDSRINEEEIPGRIFFTVDSAEVYDEIMLTLGDRIVVGNDGLFADDEETFDRADEICYEYGCSAERGNDSQDENCRTYDDEITVHDEMDDQQIEGLSDSDNYEEISRIMECVTFRF